MAIARDTNSFFNITGTNPTTTYTVTGSNPFLLLILDNNTDNSDPSSVTYAGVGMTAGSAEGVGNGGPYKSFYYLFNPSTSAGATLQINGTGSINWVGQLASYTGVYQSALDNTNYLSASGSPATHSITVNTANSWVVLGAANADGNWTASTGSNALGAAHGVQFFDSNGAQGAGSYSMSLTYGGSRSYGWWQVSIKPSVVTYTLTTAATSFSYTPKSTGEYRILTMVGAVRSFALTGMAVTFSRAKQFLLTSLPASFSLTGISTGMKRLLTMITSPTTYSFVGKAVTIAVTKVYKMVTSVASYILTGMKAGITAPIHSIWTQKVVSAVSWTIKTITPTNWTGKNQGQ